jgi:hypothetical protein
VELRNAFHVPMTARRITFDAGVPAGLICLRTELLRRSIIRRRCRGLHVSAWYYTVPIGTDEAQGIVQSGALEVATAAQIRAPEMGVGGGGAITLLLGFLSMIRRRVKADWGNERRDSTTIG